MLRGHMNQQLSKFCILGDLPEIRRLYVSFQNTLDSNKSPSFCQNYGTLGKKYKKSACRCLLCLFDTICRPFKNYFTLPRARTPDLEEVLAAASFFKLSSASFAFLSSSALAARFLSLRDLRKAPSNNPPVCTKMFPTFRYFTKS